MILLAIAINVKKAKMHLINAKLELGFAETKLFKKKSQIDHTHAPEPGEPTQTLIRVETIICAI